MFIGIFFGWVCLAYHFLTGFYIFVSSFGPTTRRNHTGPVSLRTNIEAALAAPRPAKGEATQGAVLIGRPICRYLFT